MFSATSPICFIADIIYVFWELQLHCLFDCCILSFSRHVCSDFEWVLWHCGTVGQLKIILFKCMLLRVFGLLHFFSSRNAHRCLQPVLCLFRFGWSVDTGQAVEVISSVGEAGSRVTRDKSDIWAHFQWYLGTLSKHQNCVQAASTSISPCSKTKTTLSHLVPFIVYIEGKDVF